MPLPCGGLAGPAPSSTDGEVALVLAQQLETRLVLLEIIAQHLDELRARNVCIRKDVLDRHFAKRARLAEWRMHTATLLDAANRCLGSLVETRGEAPD